MAGLFAMGDSSFSRQLPIAFVTVWSYIDTTKRAVPSCLTIKNEVTLHAPDQPGPHSWSRPALATPHHKNWGRIAPACCGQSTVRGRLPPLATLPDRARSALLAPGSGGSVG